MTNGRRSCLQMQTSKWKSLFQSLFQRCVFLQCSCFCTLLLLFNFFRALWFQTLLKNRWNNLPFTKGSNSCLRTVVLFSNVKGVYELNDNSILFVQWCGLFTTFYWHQINWSWVAVKLLSSCVSNTFIEIRNLNSYSCVFVLFAVL